MLLRLSILFITIPICEIFIFLEAGSQIGIWPTLAIVVLTGVAGAYLTRSQGFDLLLRIQSSLARNEIPTRELVDGLFILAGGILLLTPGLLTDLAGFVLLAPFSREPLKRGLTTWFIKRMERGEIVVRRF